MDLILSPAGKIHGEDAGAAPGLPRDVEQRARAAFAEGSARGLLLLAAVEPEAPLSPTFVYWREFARRYLHALCHTPGLDRDPSRVVLAPAPEELAEFIDQAPPMRGLEYLRVGTLEALWRDLDVQARGEIRRHRGGAPGWLHDINPLWRLVGRVTFHLAEDQQTARRPFAFLAAYASSLSGQGNVQYLPLGRALQEYAGARKKDQLRTLLLPVQRAAEKSALIREMLDSGAIFQPQAWTPREAYRFLKDVPLFEESGVIIRIPDWWRTGRPPRPHVSVTIGNRPAQRLGLEALLDFSVNLTLGGEAVDAAALAALLSGAEGLVRLKGKWVEIDRDQVAAALKQCKSLERGGFGKGLTLLQGLRLLSGADLESSGGVIGEQAREWTRVVPGAWLEDVLAEMRDPEKIRRRADDAQLKTPLRPYQQTGVNWLWFMYRLGLGACLADDMGLGKTIQVLALLLQLKREVDASPRGEPPAPSLLVVPASLIANWKQEIGRFAPDLAVICIHPSEIAPADLETLAAAPGRTLPGKDLVITTYGMLLRQGWLRGVGWNLVVLDEAQTVKNPAARQTRAVKALRARGRVALTGTPVENRLADLWSLFDFLCPGLLGSAKAFDRFARASVRKHAGRTGSPYGTLRALTRPYILRRLKTDKKVIADLPDKVETRAFCTLSRVQASLYRQAVDALASSVEGAAGIRRRGVILAAIMQFKQICNHPAQWRGHGDFAAAESGKFLRLRELCEELAARQEKTLVFTQFREMTRPLAGFLAGIFGHPGLVLHGGTPVGQRRSIVARFQGEDGPPFFVLSLKAGGTGLNLTAASHVIHFDRWWNPAVENQATDRAFRIGQSKNIMVHKFVCRGTVEERIDALIEEKAGLARDLLDGGADRLLTEMGNDELLRFVSLDIASALGD